MKWSDEHALVATALAAAQGELEPASKDSTNPAFRSKYADLASVWDAIRPVTKKHGLYVAQELTASADSASVCTTIMHKSGEWVVFDAASAQLVKRDPQGTGSAWTYLKRYTLCGALGIVAGEPDDDGNAASGREAFKPKAEEPVKTLVFNYLSGAVGAIPRGSEWLGLLREHIDACGTASEAQKLWGANSEVFYRLEAAARSRDDKTMLASANALGRYVMSKLGVEGTS